MEVPEVPYWAAWYPLPVPYLTPDCEVDPYCDVLNPVPDKLLELEVIDELILSMFDEDVPYGVPVTLESYGFRAEVDPGTNVEVVVLNEAICSSNSLIIVFFDLN